MMQEQRKPLVKNENLYQSIRISSIHTLINMIKAMFPRFHIDPGVKLNQDMLIFTPQAFEELQFHTHWGKVHPQNKNELKFRGIGYAYTDGQHEYFIVCYVQYLLAPDRSTVSAGAAYVELQEKDLEFYSHDYSMNPYGEAFGPPNIIFMGHTHPGNLSTQMSHTDRNTHIQTMRTEQWMTVIVNPHRMKISAYVGSGFKPLYVLIPGCEKPVMTPKAKKAKSNTYDIVLSSDEMVAKITFFTKRSALITFKKAVRMIDSAESEE
jgi:hypothetical protein